ncbi:hypothetical protein K6W56_27815, partial [Burkholderia contaminans]|nr:hypothetical protein [Burkholderia contaminans]
GGRPPRGGRGPPAPAPPGPPPPGGGVPAPPPRGGGRAPTPPPPGRLELQDDAPDALSSTQVRAARTATPHR